MTFGKGQQHHGQQLDVVFSAEYSMQSKIFILSDIRIAVSGQANLLHHIDNSPVLAPQTDGEGGGGQEEEEEEHHAEATLCFLGVVCVPVLPDSWQNLAVYLVPVSDGMGE